MVEEADEEMSGKIFKRKVGKGEIEKGATYKRGSVGGSYKTAEGLVEKFLAVDIPHYYDRITGERMNKGLVDLATAILEPRVTEEFNSQGFLDAVVFSLAEAGEPFYFCEMRSEQELLIEPVLQALYNFGHNNLIVDPMPLQYPLTDLGFYLQGRPDNLLTFTHKDNLNCLGSNVKYCKIKNHGYVRKLGQWAEHSIFYVDAPILTWLANPEALKDGEEDVICLPQDFFDNGNTLFVPDGEGGWRKLLHEDFWRKRRVPKR